MGVNQPVPFLVGAIATVVVIEHKGVGRCAVGLVVVDGLGTISKKSEISRDVVVELSISVGLLIRVEGLGML